MTTERLIPITFVGPVINAGARYGKRTWCFLLMQPDSDAPLKLEYKTKKEATLARIAMLETPRLVDVPTVRLFGAIEIALKQAAEMADNKGG